MKFYCPECGCSMTETEDELVCDDYECAYLIPKES